jgi:signal transduction histidine kinase
MSLRTRFVLLFTIIVSVILFLSSLTVYLLYSDHRKSQYLGRLENEAMLAFEGYLDKQLNQKDSASAISKEIGDNSLIQSNIQIFSKSRVLVFADTNFKPIEKISPAFFDKIKKLKSFSYTTANRECLGVYLEKESAYIIISASDTFGLEKLRRLKLILFGVFLASVITVNTLTYFFVGSALSPLLKLNNQIKETSELNLWQKVDENSGQDEIGQIAKNYNAMLGRLSKAFELQKNFVHHASHELRTPLTTMYATTEAALNKKLSEVEYRKVLTSLKEDQNSLIELTNSLLLLYQFDKLKFSPNFHTFRIDELIYDAIGYSKKVFPGVIIDFAFENIPEEKDLAVQANDVLLKSAFNNLIKNAFLYSDDKKLKISLSASNSQVQINFENRGRILSEAELQNIKVPFSRGENIGLVKGIGLGLSIVEKIINLHKGNFSYEALPDSVNRFSVKLK